MSGARFAGSIKARLAIAVVAVVAALGLSVRIFVERRLVDDMEAELESRAVTVAENLAAGSVESILYQDLLAIDRMLTSAKNTWDDLEYAFVLDSTRNVLAHTLLGDFPDELRQINRFIGGSGPQILRAETLGFRHRDVAVPIYGGQLGVLHLGFRDKSIVNRLDALRRDIVLLLVLIATVGAALVLLVTHLGLRPMATIVETLERFRPGRRRDEIPVRRDDEIGQVARRVNEITLGLHRAQIALDNENRLAAVGRVASVIAHEAGNPLASIMTRLELIAKSDDAAFVRESLPLLRAQLARIQKLVRGLSDLSRSQRVRSCSCDVSAVISDALEMLRYDPLASDIDLKLHLDQTAPVRCQREHFFQVLVNLGLNGMRAAAKEVNVSVTTVKTGVAVEVWDDGPGIPADDFDRVFEPFFTTSPDGSGLGLAISRDLMRQQGGELSFVGNDPETGGARFQLRLQYATNEPPCDVEEQG